MRSGPDCFKHSVPEKNARLDRLFSCLNGLFLFAPIIAVVILAFNPKQFGSFPMEGFSFKWFVKLSHNSTILEAFKNSMVLAVTCGKTYSSIHPDR